MMPPALLYLRVPRPGRRTLALWLPIFVLWPFVGVLAAVACAALPAVLLVAVPFGKAGVVLRCARLLPCVLSLLCALRGLRVQVAEQGRHFEITFL